MRKCIKTEEHEFTPEEINDLMVTAFEGGINHWCGSARPIFRRDKTYSGVAPEDQSKITYTSDVIGYGGSCRLTDVEGELGPWILTLEGVLKGIEKHCTNRNIAFKDLMDNHDAEDADCIVQIACMGEITFG